MLFNSSIRLCSSVNLEFINIHIYEISRWPEQIPKLHEDNTQTQPLRKSARLSEARCCCFDHCRHRPHTQKKRLTNLKLNILLNPHSPSVNFADNFVQHGLILAKLIKASQSKRTWRLEVSNSKRKQLWMSIRQNCLGKTSPDPSTHKMESTSEQHPTHILPMHMYKHTHMCP